MKPAGARPDADGGSRHTQFTKFQSSPYGSRARPVLQNWTKRRAPVSGLLLYNVISCSEAWRRRRSVASILRTWSLGLSLLLSSVNRFNYLDLNTRGHKFTFVQLSHPILIGGLLSFHHRRRCGPIKTPFGLRNRHLLLILLDSTSTRTVESRLPWLSVDSVFAFH